MVDLFFTTDYKNIGTFARGSTSEIWINKIMISHSFGRISGLVWQCAVESKVDKALMTQWRCVGLPALRSSEVGWRVRHFSDESGAKHSGVKNVWR